jgi:hypothetical protein
MSTIPIQSGNPLDQLVRSLFQTYDTNSDGKISSDEFSALIARLTGTVASSTSATPSPTSATATAPLLPTVAAVRRPRAALEGFDARKLANPEHRSQKYIFARVAQYADLSSVKDKASAEAVLRGMVPELKAAGLDVLDVHGDKIKFVGQNSGREVWVDVVRGANSKSPAFQWLPLKSE